MKNTKSEDIYWPRALRLGPYLLVPIGLLNVIAWILSITMLVYGRHIAINSFHNVIDAHDGGQYVVRMWALWVELIHLPVHTLLYLQVFQGWRLHPAAALSFALCMMAVWVNFAIWGWIVDYCNVEWATPRAWDNLAHARFAFSLLTTLVYIIYVVFACVAVHQWRNRTGKNGARRAAAYRTGSPDVTFQEVNVEAGKR